MNARDAQAIALTDASEIKLDDLAAIPKHKMNNTKYFRDKDGKLKRKVTMSNFDSKLKVGTHPYINYEDWEKYGGYHSNQWSDFELQQDAYFYAEDKSGDTFYSMDEQENFDVDEMPLYPLDIEKDVLDDFTTVLIGRRRSGKTWASRWLMYHMRHRFPYGIVITGTRLNNFWSQYVPEEFIFDIEDISATLDAVFARQTYILAHPKLGIDPRMFIILDDVMGDAHRTRHGKELARIFTDGRHMQVFLLVTLQDAKGIPPSLRENTDLCLLFRVYEGGRKQVVCEEWLSYIEEMKNLGEVTQTKTLTHQRRHAENEKRKNPKDRDIESSSSSVEEGEENERDARQEPQQAPTKQRVSRQKQQTAIKFFWRNTGLIDKKTCEAFKESKNTKEKERESAGRQAIAVLQARTTENLQEVMKKIIAEDPGPFILGDVRYYKASQTGNYKPIMGTYKEFKRRGKRRVKTEVDDSENDDSSSNSSEEGVALLNKK
jgi:hypothetical protein